MVQVSQAPDAAPRSLGQLLAPFGRDRFLAEHYGRQALHVPGTAERFAGVAGWQDLDELLAALPLWSDKSLALSLAGQPVPARQWGREGTDRLGDKVRQPDPAKLADWLRQGATLAIDFVDRLLPPVRRLAESLEAALQAPVTASFFLSWQRRQGYPAHFDTQEVFALQLIGRKAWRLYGGGFEAPVDLPGLRSNELTAERKAQLGGPLAQRVELATGDLLYVPAGQFHEALALEEASLHLSLGVMRPTAQDYLAQLLPALAAQSADLRRPLPPPGDPAAQERFLAALGQHLAAALAGPAGPASLRAHAASRARAHWSGLALQQRRRQARWRVCWPGARLEGSRHQAADGVARELPPAAAALAARLWPLDLVEESDLAGDTAGAAALEAVGFLAPLWPAEVATAAT